MAERIRHLGIVEDIDGSHLKVRIVQTSACAACSVKTYCHAVDSKEKLIDVQNSRQTDFRTEQQVVIEGAASLGAKAVMWAFVFPFVVVLFSLFAAMYFSGNDELLSAVAALCILVLYYVVLYLCRNHLKRTFVFTVKSINNQ